MSKVIKQRQSIGTNSAMPEKVKPMLCTLIKKPFNSPKFLYEVKWDGYRIVSYKNKGKVKLESRGGLDFTQKYPPIAVALSKLGHNVVLDGEVVALNSEGRPDFDALQKFNGRQSGVYYYVFDLLWIDGKSLMTLPLTKRKEVLADLLNDNSVIKFSDHFEDGIQLFNHIKYLDLEGIVAKNKDSHYLPDKRGKDWYKIPTAIRQEFVVGGWVESESRHFRTLLFGGYERGSLKWIGHAGAGYKDREMPVILSRLKRLERDTSPFVNEVDYDGVAHWVKPELVANIRYATFTNSGKIRKPAIFEGFREDKPARLVGLERAADITEIVSIKKQRTKKRSTSSDSNWRQVDRQPIRNKEKFNIENCSFILSNVDSVLWPDVTKAALIQYYNSISPYILPHIKHRPLSLHVKLKGPHAPGLYIKDMEGREPDCGEIFSAERKHKKDGKRNIVDYLVCNNLPTLLYTINLGCIDVNPWTSTTNDPERPDFVIIDLDPSDGDFSKAIEAVKAAKQMFDKHRIKAFIKTSGKTGIHIFIPCSSFNFAQSRIIAENLCHEIHSMIPNITTTAVNNGSRGSKLYLDPNQNDYTDTVAAAYSVRPYKHPNVSTPLEWKELTDKLIPENFNINNMPARLNKKGDLFHGVLDEKIAAKNNKMLSRFL